MERILKRARREKLMRILGMGLCLALVSFLLCFQALPNSNSETSLVNAEPVAKYLAGCEMDLDGDTETDIALLMDTERGRELIVLLRRSGGYTTTVLCQPRERSRLSCRLGLQISETVAGNARGRKFRTPGAFLEIIYPEASSIAYFWNGAEFKSVWTSD